MLRLTVVLFFFFARWWHQCQATTCPNVTPMRDFHMDGIIGHWYEIQRTNGKAACITAEITAVNARKGIYELTEISPSKGLTNVLGLQHEHKVKYRLQVPNSAVPAVMDLSLPLVSYKLTVLDTDYDNYVAFVLCNKRFSLLQSKTVVAILSRTNTLSPQHLESIYTKLLSYSISPFTIEMINQQECPERGQKGVLLKTASNIFGTIKDTVGGIAGKLMPKKPEDKNDPSVTGEYQIDVRSSFT